MNRKRSRPEIHLNWPEKVPERSGKTDATEGCASSRPRAGMGTRCWSGRRPGGSDLAITNQGSQANLSLPPSCTGVSYSKQCDITTSGSGSVRTNEMERKTTRVAESSTPPEPSKGPPATECADGCGGLGPAQAARGF